MNESPGNDAGHEPPESPGSPSNPPSPSESPSEGAPSRASRTASSAASGPFLEDPGPEFRADAASANGAGEPEPEQPPPAELHALPEPAQLWERETVESILTAQGSLLHSAAGVGQGDWLYTESDLMAIAPPLTRILNRYPTTRAAAGTGDELALMVGLGGYVSRSYRERKAVLQLLASQVQEEPVSGRAAEPGTGPPPEPEQPGGESPWRTE